MKAPVALAWAKMSGCRGLIGAHLNVNLVGPAIIRYGYDAGLFDLNAIDQDTNHTPRLFTDALDDDVI